MKNTIGVRKYALEQARMLLRRLAYQVNRVAKSASADAVHDLRVSIRRFVQCLRLFGEFFPPGAEKKIRKRLKKIMNLAGEVRNRDIALELVRAAGIMHSAAAVDVLSRGRDEAGRRLLDTLARWRRRDFSRKWRAQLEL